MQTFLPYSDFTKTAKCLDRQRLGKQRVEAWQILQAITNEDYGWQNHPVVKMWRGHPRLLCLYGLMICDEWKRRGYKDTLRSKFFTNLVEYDNEMLYGDYAEEFPLWYNDDVFHSSHRSTLLYKNYEHYSQFGWSEKPKYNYVWPIK